MYAEKYPEVDDVVMVKVKTIADMGAYVSLLEYNNIEGMILLSELSRRRIRSLSALIKVGNQEPVTVVRVDKQKGYIDLSKRRVAEEDVANCEAKYNKSKTVHSIMKHVAETMNADLEVRAYRWSIICESQSQVLSASRVSAQANVLLVELLFQDLYLHVAWPLYAKYGHAFEVPLPNHYNPTNNWLRLGWVELGWAGVDW